MVIAALSFELQGATKIGAALFVISWLLVLLTLYEAGWLRSRKRRQAAAILILLALIFTGSWWWLLPAPPVSAEDIANEVVKRIPQPMPSNARMHISDQRFVLTEFPLKSGQRVAVSFYPVNDGPGTAENFHHYSDIGFIDRGTDEDLERTTDALFKTLYHVVNKTVSNGEKGPDISPNDSTEPLFTAGEEHIAAEDARGFNHRRKVFVAITRIEWNNTQWAERCVYFIPEQVQYYLTSSDHKIVWNECKGHNDSGVRRSGSLL